MKTVYSLMWGQCTDVMRQKVEATSGFNLLWANGDGLGLLLAIKDLVYYFQSQKYLSQALHESVRQFYLYMQGRHMTTQMYLEMFQNTVDVIEHSGGGIGHHPGVAALIAHKQGLTVDLMTDVQKEAVKKEAHDEYLGAAFLLNTDRTRYVVYL
jgi:hypothetical protein